MSQNQSKTTHRWSFYRAGGVDQVSITTGADILNLDSLDQKLWVALSCPVKGLELDPRTLQLLDADGDGFVRPPELRAAVKWLREVLKDGDSLLDSSDSLPLAALRKDTADGKALLASSKHILQSLGKADATAITVADALATADVMKNSKRNGDGVVPPATVADEAARAVAADVVDCMGGAADRSGDAGFDQAMLDAFFAACADYDAWHKEAEGARKSVMPFGDATADAYAAHAAVKAKVDDYFGRCRLAAFDARALAAVNREEAAYMAAAAKDLNITADEVASFPLAVVAADKPLPLAKGVNPAWAGAIGKLRATCCTGKDAMTEVEWLAIGDKLAPYAAWSQKQSGAAVAKLGIARVRAILAGKAKEVLAAEIQADLAVAGEVASMQGVEKLVHLHRDLYTLVKNYVSFSDFYSRDAKAVFQAGTLYVDGRSLDLCFLVQDAGKHATMAPMAKTYLAYVDCTRPGGLKMQVACAFTAGDSDNLFVGRNGIFYDRKGNDWNATITKIVDNPISIRQAFWSPYKKLMRWIEEQINKRAAAADAASGDKLTAAAGKAGEAAAAGKPAEVKKIDPATVALFSVAISAVGGMLATVLAVFTDLGAWLPLALVGAMLGISGPSMILAWLKLRQRNLGPILDANGWAVNTLTKVNIPLGGSLTALPRLPEGSKRSLVDPFAPKRSIWPRLLLVLLILAGIAYGLYRTNLLHKLKPEWFPAHHTEVDLGGSANAAPAGAVIELTVRSADDELDVVDATDGGNKKPKDKVKVEAGKASWTIPADAKPGTVYEIVDSCGGGTWHVTVEAPK